MRKAGGTPGMRTQSEDGPSELVSIAEIRQAARLLDRVAVRTPLMPVPGLSPRLLVKPEYLAERQGPGNQCERTNPCGSGRDGR